MIQSGMLEANSAKQVAETSKRNAASVFLAWLECNWGAICCTKCILGGDGDLSLFFPVD